MGLKFFRFFNFAVCAFGVIWASSAGLFAQTFSSDELKRRFAVDRMPLGHVIVPSSQVYRAYRCNRSEQFIGHFYCSRQVNEGRVSSRYTILHDERMQAQYVSRGINPAQFRPGDIENEIRRLSELFKLEPARLDASSRSMARGSMIVHWGTLELEPIDRETSERIAAGLPVRAGMMIDFLNNLQRSAREGLPIFSIRGDFGYLYVPSFVVGEEPQLRITTANPGAYEGRWTSPQVAAAQPTPADPQKIAEERAQRDLEESQRREIDSRRREIEQKRREDDRLARLAKMEQPAKQLIADASAMISSNPDLANLLDYVDQLAQLNGALAQNDPDALERRIVSLSTALEREPAYQGLQKARNEDKARQAALHLGQTVELVKRRRIEILRYLAEDPASPIAASFLPLMRQIDPSLQSPNFDVIQPLSEKIELLIRQSNLQERFARYAAFASPVPKTQDDAGAIPRTARTTALFDGDKDDLLIYFNATNGAPNVARNLRGDLDFNGGRANVCVIQPETDERTTIQIKKAVRGLSATGVDVRVGCKVSDLGSSDLVAAVRTSLLRMDRQEALALARAVESDQFRPASIQKGEDRRRAFKEEEHVSRDIEQDILANSRRGYGMIVFNGPSSAICMMTTDLIEGHRQSLQNAVEDLALAMNKSPETRLTTAEEGFRLVQRGECGAAYQSSEGLVALIQALKREGITYSIAPVWFTQDAISSAHNAVSDRRDATAIAEANRVRKASELAVLEAQKKRDQGATAEATQERFRSEFKEKANNAGDRVASIVREWANSKTGNAPHDFPQYVAWLRQKQEVRWQIQSIAHEISDYGVILWKDRPVEAVLSQVTLRLRNTFLGEYETACFQFGFAIDAEFSVLRTPIEVRCTEVAGLAIWKRDNRFTSRWNFTKE